MRALFEIKISDAVLQKHGYTQEDVVELTKKMAETTLTPLFILAIMQMFVMYTNCNIF